LRPVLGTKAQHHRCAQAWAFPDFIQPCLQKEKGIKNKIRMMDLNTKNFYCHISYIAFLYGN
jgi:hypothetical protein